MFSLHLRRFLIGVTALAAWNNAAAQKATGIAAVDSAAVAREAWARGVRAFSAKNVRLAQLEMTRAATAWPSQPSYLWGRTLTSALLDDTAGVLAGFRGYVAVGLGRVVRGDTLLGHFSGASTFRDLAARLDSNVAPLVRSRTVASLPDSTFWPEGVDFDPRTGNYYVASIRHRTIAEVRPDGSVRELWPRGRAGLGAIMGVRVDAARGVLWATMSGVPQMEGYSPADSAISALLRIRVRDGAIERRWDVPIVPRGHTLGDLAIGPRGDVFMTDSNEPVLYRLRPGADTLEHRSHPLFHSLQGMAPTPDGRLLYVADYSHGLLRVDLGSGAITRIADAPGSSSLGCDGIVLDPSGAIVAVQNGVTPARIMRYMLDSTGYRIRAAQVLDRNSAIADEPTIGTIANGEFVYVANSQWEKYDDGGARKRAVPLTAPVLLGVPLPRP